MDWKGHIEINPAVMTGKPVIKGTRITVEHIVWCLASGWSHEQITDEYPGVTSDHILGCLAYAHDVIEDPLADELAGAT